MALGQYFVAAPRVRACGSVLAEGPFFRFWAEERGEQVCLGGKEAAFMSILTSSNVQPEA